MRIDRIKFAHAMVDKDMSVSVLSELTGLSRGTISGT